MPTYEYKCAECGIRFERFQHFSEAPVSNCPECNGPVHRVIQPVGIVFKGKGFYVTDHRGDTRSLMPKPEDKGAGNGSTKESLAAEAPKETATNKAGADKSD